MKIRWFGIIISAAFVLLMSGLVACELLGVEEDPTVPTTPIFSDVEKIELSSPINGSPSVSSFVFEVPDKVEFVVLAIFSSHISTSGKTITNPEDWEGGNRTGLAGFNPSNVSVANLWTYDQGTSDYTSTPYTPVGGPFYWAVWGYDNWGNLTHASPEWYFNN